MGYFEDLVLNYLVKPESQMNRICRPLMERLDIPYFGYVYVDSKGRYCNLSNNIAYLDYFYSKDLYFNFPYCRSPDLYRSGFTVCPLTIDSDSPKNRQFLFDAHLMQVMLIQKHADVVEQFYFLKRFNSITDYIHFLNYFDLLTKFANYFKKEAKSLIEVCLCEGYNIKKALAKKFNEPHDSILLLNKERQVETFLKDISPLSKRERECLDYFKQGNSAQMTAAQMGLSQRTVEHYFDSIKNKLGCKSKWDLLKE